jgi:hypothetical protein
MVKKYRKCVFLTKNGSFLTKSESKWTKIARKVMKMWENVQIIADYGKIGVKKFKMREIEHEIEQKVKNSWSRLTGDAKYVEWMKDCVQTGVISGLHRLVRRGTPEIIPTFGYFHHKFGSKTGLPCHFFTPGKGEKVTRQASRLSFIESV